MIKKLFATAALAVSLSTSAVAEYTIVVPQKPGGGTTVWTEIVTQQLEKHLGKEITLKLIPGARDIPGINAWHNQHRFDDKTIVVTHGGNGVSFLQEQVDYNYADYESIGLMNLNIIAGKTAGDDMSNPRFAAGSGMVPEAFAMTMLICGPDKTVDEYVACFKDNVNWVPGMSGGERRLAFQRGELNGTRENPAKFKSSVQPLIDEGKAEVWFHHGILQTDGSHADDPNYPGMQFEILFKQRWGVAPSGELYDAYKLVKSFRDGLQKAIWINTGNPNRQELVDALTAMVNDPASMAVIESKVGQYDWVIGDAGNTHRDTLMTFITEPALKTLVKFNQRALGLNSVLKAELYEK